MARRQGPRTRGLPLPPSPRGRGWLPLRASPRGALPGGARAEVPSEGGSPSEGGVAEPLRPLHTRERDACAFPSRRTGAPTERRRVSRSSP